MEEDLLPQQVPQRGPRLVHLELRRVGEVVDQRLEASNRIGDEGLSQG